VTNLYLNSVDADSVDNIILLNSNRAYSVKYTIMMRDYCCVVGIEAHTKVHQEINIK
jgi:hypothetical protein